MSSHREAPRISNDPAADNTDLYAFMSSPTKVAILANFIPFEKPEGGPNFFQFGNDVLYEIKIDNDGDAEADVTYQFRFKRQVLNPNTFLYNTFPITLDATGPFPPYSPSWNVRQRYSVTRVVGDEDDGTVLGTNLVTPPVNIGPRSIPVIGGASTYPALASAAIHTIGARKFFAGQREDAFNVDLGSIFDLGTLRPFQGAHALGAFGPSVGKDGTKGFNVHTIALEVPREDLTRDGATPSGPTDPIAAVGIWASASRQKGRVRDEDGEVAHVGKWVQVSRLGMPLINEVIIPVGKKDKWNSREPEDDEDFLPHYLDPELQNLLPVLYPGVFPNLAARLALTPKPPRNDLKAILLTGIPGLNFTGSTAADLLRLNVAIPPATTPNPFGVLAGDPAGFPNGRRIGDSVVAIELRAIAGLTIPLAPVGPTFTPDGAAGALLDGTANDVAPLTSFPYLGHPHQGYDHVHD